LLKHVKTDLPQKLIQASPVDELQKILYPPKPHNQVGPQPKGNIIKGLCCQKRRPFLFGVSPGQVWAKFCTITRTKDINRSYNIYILNSRDEATSAYYIILY